MSKTFTSRPAVKTNGKASSNNRQTPSENLSRGVLGRGRGVNNNVQTNRGRGRAAGQPSPSTSAAVSTVSRGRGTNSVTNTNTRRQSNHRMEDFQNSDTGACSSPQTNCPNRESGDQQGQYVGGFTKFEPNTKKRQQVSEMARKETQEYERFKQQNAVKYCNYVGTTGGGVMTEDMVRRKQANDVRNQKFNRLQDQQKRKEERREAEQREIDLKRAEARKKADDNANHYRSARPEDVRRKREDFLKQLESQSKAATTTTATGAARNSSDNASSSSASSPASKNQSKSPQQQQPPQPSQPLAHQQYFNRHPDPQPRPDTSAMGWGNEEEDHDHKKFDVEDFPEEVMTLAAMFPEMDMTYLNGLYKDAGSVDAVLDIIGV